MQGSDENISDSSTQQPQHEQPSYTTHALAGSLDRALYTIVKECDADSASALLAFKTLKAITSNLLREPSNVLFQILKPTNPALKQRLCRWNGGMQFLRLLGFQDSTDNSLKIENVIEREALLKSAQLIIVRHVTRQKNFKPPNLRQEQMAQKAAEEAEREFPSDRDLKIIDLSLGQAENPRLAPRDEEYESDDVALLRQAAASLSRRAVNPISHIRVRIRVDACVYVEALFRLNETIDDVFGVFRSLLKEPDTPFQLLCPPTLRFDSLTPDFRTLKSLGFVPAVLLLLHLPQQHLGLSNPQQMMAQTEQEEERQDSNELHMAREDEQQLACSTTSAPIRPRAPDIVLAGQQESTDSEPMLTEPAPLPECAEGVGLLSKELLLDSVLAKCQALSYPTSDAAEPPVANKSRICCKPNKSRKAGSGKVPAWFLKR